MERHTTMDSMDETPMFLPRVFIALEYIEQEQILNFYIKKIDDPPLFVEGRKGETIARMTVMKNVSKTTWMGRQRIITDEEMAEKSSEVYKTLSVRKRNPTIFNEFFSHPVENELFHRTLLRIQLIDVGKNGREVITGETDYWIDSNPINRFTQFALPMNIARPDLGELEFSLMYQPTIGRIVIADLAATNLPCLKDTKNLIVRGRLFVKKHFFEEEKSEELIKFGEESNSFVKKLIFDVNGKELPDATLILTILQRKENGWISIGEVLLSHRNPSCDRLHWMKMLSLVREKHIEVHKILPAL
ncbi:hypothetical protein PFISCL1PPCAC_5970 [Pristionchus fissidentatus]|uniref:Uncharacterized protein n=1 Tax=Pristionchus fissidentatus TaxID=1538716 RepID=A0AAV5V6C4_9BILA|nr:hypothetical protein PFISCL1PPCAC_5970 [Pristionchus fissidentatus]